MRIPKTVQENLRFLTIEVGAQVGSLRAYYEDRSVATARKVLDRARYTHNLKTTIHRSCHGRLAEGGDPRGASGALQALEDIASDLERISELCRECIEQTGSMADASLLPTKRYRRDLRRVEKAIGRVEEAVTQNDTRLAVKIGRVELELERAFEQQMSKTIRKLKRRRKGVPDRVRALFIGQSIERMGTVLRSVSESIISANLGQPFNTERFHSLQASIDQLGDVDDTGNLVLETIAETRSGAAIAGVSHPEDKGDGFRAIYKEGQKRKLKEERQGVESWHEIYPGLAPRILSYHRRGQSASLLIEHLSGMTFEQILLQEPGPLLRKASRKLRKTLKAVWKETRTERRVSADFMKQLRRRLDGIYAHHPGFQQSDGEVCGLGLPSFDRLLEDAAELEESLAAPFSVYIHGDFNVDNIIYDPVENRINFIDLHRSCHMDYVQDISVFMVSNYRLQVVNQTLRRQVLEVAREFYDFAAQFAAKRGDETFELRLALGLARSFATSTRFILDETLARAMFLRSKLLLEIALANGARPRSEFRLPIQELFDG